MGGIRNAREFAPYGETVETVEGSSVREATSLKRGVNERGGTWPTKNGLAVLVERAKRWTDRLAVNGFGGIEMAAEDVEKGFDGKFHEEERFGDEIVAAAHSRIGAAFEVIEAGDKHNGRFFVSGQGTHLGAQFEAVHARHVHIQKNQIEMLF